MASRQNSEVQGSYVDNIKVKISERYKPPRKINLAMTYSQRLTLNKQVQDNIPNYDFALENCILERLKEREDIKKQQLEQRKVRLEEARELMQMKKEEEKQEELEVKTVNETVTNNQQYLTYPTSSNILMPTKATYSNILTPIPLKDYSSQSYVHKSDRSPFNLSDFENDTSSPFDNMELKSINDLEELAQVLKTDKVNTTSYYGTVPYTENSRPSHIPQVQSNYQYSYSIPSSAMYMQPVGSEYSHTNGYYYATPDSNPTYMYSKQSCYDYGAQDSPLKKSSCKSVPDIVKSVDEEFGNVQIDDKPSFVTNKSISTPVRPKSTDAVYLKTKVKEELEDPFDSLTMKQQELCRSITSMGFPLGRVARVCQLLGPDHKKIVEHLLVLSDLLDLGFQEKIASKALLDCDNDRDKALDRLIT